MKRNIILLLFSLLFSSKFAVATTIVISEFEAGSLQGWQSKQFQDNTEYQLWPDQGTLVLRASSKASASGLIKKQRIDLQQTPYLNWRWRIDNRLLNLQEQQKSGDDYAARLYVLIDGGLLFWKTLALNYVWSATTANGTIWPNAFAGKNAMMLAIRSGKDPLKVWQSEKRNVHQDLKRVFGKSIRYIDAIAIMTDTDNSGMQATAYYSKIFFSEQ